MIYREQPAGEGELENVRQLHSVFRDTSPRHEGWLHLAKLPDPLQAASRAMMVVVVMGSAAWALRDEFPPVAAIVGVAFVGAMFLLMLIIGRTAVWDQLAIQKGISLKVRRELDIERKRNELLGDLIGDVLDVEHGIERPFAAFVEDAVEFLRVSKACRNQSGIVVARASSNKRYVVEAIAGDIGDPAVRPGKSCSGERPFAEVLKAIAPSGISVKGESSAGVCYWLGIVTTPPEDRVQESMVRCVAATFIALVKCLESFESDDVSVPSIARCADSVILRDRKRAPERLG